jgi:TatD DNase family protein
MTNPAIFPVIDSHCHLDCPDFDPDREQVISRAQDAGVAAIISSGVDCKTNLSSLRLAEEHAGIYATVGLSPALAVREPEQAEEVLRQLPEAGEQAIGIGEAGLDYHYFKEPAERRRQQEVFRKVIEIAGDLGKPLVIHGRDAEEECLRMAAHLDTVIFHCYGGSIETMEQITDAGHYISIPTLVCFSRHHREITARVPPELMLVETDSPYLSPRKGRNEPACVTDAVRTVAKVRNMETGETAAITLANTKRAFTI